MRIYLCILFGLIVSCAKGGSNSNPQAGCLCQATNRSDAKNANPGPGTAYVFGDSLANGHGAAPTSANAPVGCLKQFGQPVVSFAEDGLTSDVVLNMMKKQLVNVQPHLIFISVGGDDAIWNHYQPGVFPAAKTLQNMEEIFNIALKTRALVVYLALRPPHPDSAVLPQIWDLATQKGVIVVDGMAGLWTDKSEMMDQFHPNEVGYQKMCQRIISAVKPFYP